MNFDPMTFLVASSVLTLVFFAYFAIRAIFVFAPTRKTNFRQLPPAVLVEDDENLFNQRIDRALAAIRAGGSK